MSETQYDADESDCNSPPPAYKHLFPETSVVVNTDRGISHTNVINERSPLIDTQTKVYKKRWYILSAYSLLAFTQGGLWNTWGPIAASTEEAFGWTDADIALLSNWGPIAYILAAFILSWVVDVKGLRWACIITSFLVALGSGLRCITDQPPYVKWTIHAGQLLNGLAGPVAMGVPPVLSAAWFPVEERTTATALTTILNSIGVGVSFLIGIMNIGQLFIGLAGPCGGMPPILSVTWFPVKERVTATSLATIAAFLGISMSYIVGPYMVTDKPPTNDTVGNTTHNISYGFSSNYSMDLLLSSNSNTEDRIGSERKEIMRLMYVECAWSVFVFLLLLIYFPAKPPLPPTLSASIDRLDFKSGAKLLIRNGKFWLICLTYGVSLGVFNCWQSVLDVILKPHNISEKEAGWLGFYAILAGCAGSIVLARFADAFSRHMKLLLVILYVGSSICFVWFSLLIQGTLPNSTVSLYVAIILSTLLLNSAVPLYFEMACEVSYPVAEGITNFVLTLVNNVGGLIFLLVQMIPSLGTGWENWAALGAIVSCIPVLLLFKEKYSRLELDEVKHDPES